MDFAENENFHKITRTNKNTQKLCLLFKEKQLQNMFEKSQILRATPHQHIYLKQSLKIEIHKFWMSNMHKICGSQNCIKMVINNSSGYYNMFSYINLGFYQTWDEFLRELQLIHKSQTVIFFGKFDFLWCFSIYPSMSYFEELIHESSFFKIFKS